MSQTAESERPAVIVIFGVTGDLAHRYLLPSLYHLLHDGLLHPKTKLVGLSRRDLDKDDFFADFEKRLVKAEICDQATLTDMKQRTDLRQLDMDSASAFKELLDYLNSLEDSLGSCLNRLYYLSIPPQAQLPVIKHLGEQDLNQSCQHGEAETRLLIEKPFGYDLASAEQLISATAKYFSEEQLFRIDHFLAKETVQNILTFRFKNPIFETIWNNHHIASIDIFAKESIGIEGRVAFYEPLGALRDLIQSHLLQILGIILMDQPPKLEAAEIHAAKQAALAKVSALKPSPQTLVRGQYEGYKKEVNNPSSTTETYAELTVFSAEDRWQNVPLRLYSGKALDEKDAEVLVSFHNPSDPTSNSLRFRIQPREGIELDLVTKKPGFDYATEITAMDFSYQNSFGNQAHPSAYEKVLIDAARGDHTLFATSQEIMEAWRIVQPALDKWAKSDSDLIIYKPGSESVK